MTTYEHLHELYACAKILIRAVDNAVSSHIPSNHAAEHRSIVEDHLLSYYLEVFFNYSYYVCSNPFYEIPSFSHINKLMSNQEFAELFSKNLAEFVSLYSTRKEVREEVYEVLGEERVMDITKLVIMRMLHDVYISYPEVVYTTTHKRMNDIVEKFISYEETKKEIKDAIYLHFLLVTSTN